VLRFAALDFAAAAPGAALPVGGKDLPLTAETVTLVGA
jgi:hypothetical protein